MCKSAGNTAERGASGGLEGGVERGGWPGPYILQHLTIEFSLILILVARRQIKIIFKKK
jgi:hypothetical protein